MFNSVGAPLFIFRAFPHQSFSWAGRLIYFSADVQGNSSIYLTLIYHHRYPQFERDEVSCKRLSECSTSRPIFVFPGGILAIWRFTSSTTIFSPVPSAIVFERQTSSTCLFRLMPILEGGLLLREGFHMDASPLEQRVAVVLFMSASALPSDHLLVMWWPDGKDSDCTERGEHHLWSFQLPPQNTTVYCESFMMNLYLCLARKMRTTQ